MAVAIDGMDEITREFLSESAEGLDVFERDLVELEREPGSPGLLAEIFRAVHTLKGNSGALGYPKLESIAHAGENALGLLRDGKLTLSSELTSGLLAMVDALRGLLKAIEETGNEGDGNYRSVVDLLKELSESSMETNETSEELRRETLSSAKTESLSSEKHIYRGLKPARDDNNKELTDTPKGVPLQNVSPNRLFQQPPRTLSPNLAPVPTPAAEELHDAALAASVRVNVGVLDRMMNLVGELVLTRNQVLHSALRQSDASFADAAQRLKSVTDGLQESVMKARMQPIGRLWNKLPRLARDMAAQCGKQVAIEMKGPEIELDRTILEAIKDPLTHILRNAIDHGIESPERRTEAGKTVVGHVFLSAFHEGGRVLVEIRDDGAGINLPRVRERAAKRGLITVQQAASMNEQELTRLVFTPGFSTAETVTNLSGRGVGLDVVKTNIERIGGMLDLQSVTGQGITLKFNLPLTLAVLPALIVNSGGERFAIPQASLIELVRLEPKQEPDAIEQVYGAAVYRWRDELLPVVFLDSELRLPPQNTEATYIVVLEVGAQQFGLVVDAIADTEEIVIKPLGRRLRGLGCFAGAAILGDGRVALILDIAGVAQSAKVASDRSVAARERAPRAEGSPDPATQNWVTFRGATGTRFALPLSAVTRLEEIPAENVERSHGREVVQYCGRILPLLRNSDLFREPALERDPLQVVVLREIDESMGLVVDRIEDIVEETVELRSGRQSGLLQGAAVIDERVADVLDVKGILALARESAIPTAAER